MLYAIIFGGIALFTFVIGGWAYWAGNQRSTEVTAFARERGLDLVVGRQEVEPDPSFALLRPSRVLQRYVIERMAWPGDDDSVFVFTAKWRDLVAETEQTLIRTCVRVRLPVDAPSV